MNLANPVAHPRKRTAGESLKNCQRGNCKYSKFEMFAAVRVNMLAFFSGWVFQRKMSLFVYPLCSTCIEYSPTVCADLWSISVNIPYVKHFFTEISIVFTRSYIVQIGWWLYLRGMETTRFFWTPFKCSPFRYHPRHDVRFPYIWITENHGELKDFQ